MTWSTRAAIFLISIPADHTASFLIGGKSETVMASKADQRPEAYLGLLRVIWPVPAPLSASLSSQAGRPFHRHSQSAI